MIEEPYRWVEAIANRREYIETQLAEGSPVVAISVAPGILLATLSGPRQKIFEIYDRIALGAIGHPGDIERLRMAAIEVASTEGFTRSAADVSLRRLAHYSLSPALKTAFEQVYGPPYLARLLFAELGAAQEQDLFLRLDFDGTIATHIGEGFAVVAGSADSAATMETYLRERIASAAGLEAAAHLVRDTLKLGAPATNDLAIQASLLDRNTSHAIRYRALEKTAIPA
jgi:proteasome alpha subunit